MALASVGASPPDPLDLRSLASQDEVDATPDRLAVLPVLIGATSLEVSIVFRGVDRASEDRPVRVMSVDDYFFQDGQELSRRALACGEDTECLARALAVFRADLGLVVIANTDVRPPLLALVLVDTERQKVLADRFATLDGTSFDDQLEAEVGALFEQSGLTRSGRLEILVEPADASISVAAHRRPDLDAAHRYTLAPGRYPVRARAPDHDPIERMVEIRPGEVTRLELRLKPRTTLWKSPWLWGGVITAVLVAGTVTTLVLTQDGPANCLCVIGANDESCLRCP